MMMDNEIAEGRKQRYALLFCWYVIATIGLLFFFYGQYQTGWARTSAKWPAVFGQIVTSEVTTDTNEGETTYSDRIKYVYTVDGVEYQSSVVVIGGHEYSAHNVVARYPLGTEVSVAYDPNKPSRAVLEPGVESYGFQELGFSMFIGVLFMGSLINFLLRRALNEDNSALDHLLIFLFKVVAFPITVCTGNLWVLGGMIALSVWLETLELHPVLTYGSAIFAGLYGVIWVLLLWIHFMGWLQDWIEQYSIRYAIKRKPKSKPVDTD